MVCLRRFVIAALVTSGCVAPLPQPGPDAPAIEARGGAPEPGTDRQCEWGWSAPQDLLSLDGRRTYVESPTLAHGRSGPVIVGTPSFFWATRDAFDPPPGPTPADTAEYIERLRTNHSHVGMRLDERMRATGLRFPQRLGGLLERAVIASDAKSGVHLYYITRPEDSVAVWHARLYGELWSTPERVLTDNVVRWQWAQLRADAGGDLHLVVPVFRTGSDGGSGIAYLRQWDDTHRTAVHFQRGMPYYASVLPFGSDSLLIAFNGLHPVPGSGNGSHLFLIRASETDAALPRATRIHDSGARVASWPRLFRDSSSRGVRTGILWLSAPSGSNQADSVHVMTTADGVAWTSPSSLGLPVPAQYLTSVSSAASGIHAVTHSNRDGDAALHVHWHDGAWRRAQTLPFRGIASAPSLLEMRADSLLLMWGVALGYAGAPPEAPRAPASRYAWLTPRCP